MGEGRRREPRQRGSMCACAHWGTCTLLCGSSVLGGTSGRRVGAEPVKGPPHPGSAGPWGKGPKVRTPPSAGAAGSGHQRKAQVGVSIHFRY